MRKQHPVTGLRESGKGEVGRRGSGEETQHPLSWKLHGHGSSYMLQVPKVQGGQCSTLGFPEGAQVSSGCPGSGFCANTGKTFACSTSILPFFHTSTKSEMPFLSGWPALELGTLGEGLLLVFCASLSLQSPAQEPVVERTTTSFLF